MKQFMKILVGILISILSFQNLVVWAMTEWTISNTREEIRTEYPEYSKTFNNFADVFWQALSKKLSTMTEIDQIDFLSNLVSKIETKSKTLSSVNNKTREIKFVTDLLWYIWELAEYHLGEITSENLWWDDLVFETELYKIENKADWEEYSMDYYGLEIKWFLSPLESDSDLFRENLNIVYEEPDTQMTLEEYFEYSLDWLEWFITNFELNYYKEIELSGLATYEINYTGNDSGYDVDWTQFITLKDGIFYVLTYTKELDNTTYDQVVVDMIKSFEIK